MKKEKTIIEYPDSPSGSVVFYNYKEPLMKYENGYGYQGAIIYDVSSGQLQCHICGEWFDMLGGHTNREHGIRAAEYKSMVGLNQSSALISEQVRSKMIANGLEKRVKNLRKGGGVSKSSRKKISESMKNWNSEKQNTRNTCPEQLLQRFIDLYNKLGRTPKYEEIPFLESLRRVHGSVKNVCEITGIPYRKQGGHINPFRHTPDSLLKSLRTFKELNNREPSWSDARRKLIPPIQNYINHFGSWNEAKRTAFAK